METLIEILPHAFEHAFVDTLKLVPFLFATYLAMEALEHYAGAKSEAAVRRAGKAGPAIGALLGVVPQCGFSAAAGTLYAARVVSLGTLFAVLLSTSDEMLPIMIAEQVSPGFIVKVLAIKVVIAMACGFAVDAALRARHRGAEALRIHDLCERDRCGCDDEDECGDGGLDAGGAAPCAREFVAAKADGIAASKSDDPFDGGHSDGHGHDGEVERGAHGRGHAHGHAHAHGLGSIARSAFVHTVQVTLFIFLVSFALEVAIDAVGEDALAEFMAGNPALSVVTAAIVGLIPNCAASVAITELYLEGALGAGAMLGGLLVSAGVGLLVLFRSNRPMRDNFAIAAGLVAVGAAFGALFTAVGLVL